MVAQLITRGKNITATQLYLLQYMDSTDVTNLINKTDELVQELPNPNGAGQNRQGLLLGLVQSGKTGGLTTTIAMSADNGYRCFVVLTTDNLWLYSQTIKRLKGALPGLQIVGKDDWEKDISSITSTFKLGVDAVVFVTTKNANWLNRLLNKLDKIKAELGGTLPSALVIDDEADQASLDTQTSRRALNPSLDPGKINDLITKIRSSFSLHTYLQVTATPQALFLQDASNPYRPEFTILIEPGKGYIGSNTFFSLINGQGSSLIRNFQQQDIDNMINSQAILIPISLKDSLCAFFVGAAIKCIQQKDNKRPGDLVYSFLCHVSQKKADHEKIQKVISEYYQILREGLSPKGSPSAISATRNDLLRAYTDISSTLTGTPPSFQSVLDELGQYIIGTEIQVLNSDKEQEQPNYDRRFNVLIGGTKLARGVTIQNLLVTYYGRQPRTTNMDTMLQHARMYGYREKDLDVTRLFVTPEVEERFRLINESEEALRKIIEKYPNEIYRGISIGRGLRATRGGVLNPINVGAYAGGSHYFPRQPIYQGPYVQTSTAKVEKYLDNLFPQGSSQPAKMISIDKMVEILKLSKWSESSASGLWNDARIIAALETLNQIETYKNIGYLIIRKNRNIGKRKDSDEIGAVLDQDIRALANINYPTLFMYLLNGTKSKGWDDKPFWVPTLRFPDGGYALMFNFN